MVNDRYVLRNIHHLQFTVHRLQFTIMPLLKIALLGPFTITIDNKPVAFRTDAERALLAYLAAHQGIPQRRDTLAALLSPDRNDSAALTYLRNRLTRLRSAIADENATPSWLTIDRKQITLRTGDDIVIDISQFEQLLTAVEQHPHRTLAGCSTCLTRLDEAVALVRSELLAGLNFPSDLWEAWLLGRREHIQQRALHAMTLLRDARIDQGDWAAALALAQRQLVLEPWLETAHRALMSAHDQLGDRNAALAHYEQCAALLWEELGVEPEEETTALFERLQEGYVDPPAGSRQPSTIPDNLPLATGRFFGRATEKAHLLERLADPHARLVTLVGTGGVGKTRLALEVGRAIKANFPDGVWFVALDGIHGEPGRVGEQIQIAVGEAIGLGQMTGNDAAKQRSGEQVLAILRDKRLLLILDNCETVLDDLGFVPAWLSRAPDMVILATAREPLNFGAEAVVPLAGLAIGEPPIGDLRVGATVRSDHESGAAEALFMEQAQMARADFTLSPENQSQVRRICQLVDGLPLGIALAAAWVRRRSLVQIIDSIQASLDFLSTRLRDVEPRHRSMRAVFETSWQMLDAEEQAMLAALSVFPTSFSAEAAEQVTGAQLFDLDLFSEKSLLQQQQEVERYRLHSLVRQFVGEKLERRKRVIEQAFVEYYFHFARDHQDDYTALQPEWLNFAEAISKAHTLEAWQRVRDLVETIYEPWDRQLRLSDMHHGLTLALDAATSLQDRPAMARTLLRLAELAVGQSKYELAEVHLADALQHYLQLEAGLGIAHTKYLLGRIKSEQAQDSQALALFAASKRIYEDETDLLGVARNLNAMAYCHIMHDPASPIAQAYLQESLALRQTDAMLQANVGSQAYIATQTYVEALLYLARIKSSMGDLATAEEHLIEATKAGQAQENIELYVMVLFERIVLSRRRNQLDTALRIGHECLNLVQTVGNVRREGLVQTQFGLVYQAQKQPAQALFSFQSGLAIFVALGDRFEQAFSHICLYELYAEMGESEQSHRSKQEALRLNAELQNPWLEEQLK